MLLRWTLVLGAVLALWEMPLAPAAAAERPAALFEVVDQRSTPWLLEPDWTTFEKPLPESEELEQPRPEPIPLPAAGIIGPALLTGLIAAASLKKRRRRARVLR